ncbi:MAG: site-specific DNA-methyltransferase [Pseudomonadota bacterium]|nr:site-specific DNA-methyltransferase [Pseudomonadota bacterium]
MQGDCLELMSLIPDGSIDCIITDPPYGTTACKWDSVIPFEPMWAQLKRVIKTNGAIILFGSQPFTSALVMSNIKMFKYCWIWEKSRFSNQMLAKKQPLKIHEDISVFAKGSVSYVPQGLIEVNKTTRQGSKITDNNGGGKRATEYQQTHTNYPKSIQRFSSEGKTIHPTQKPVALIEYLIKTYTNEGETVLDFTMGSGTTGVACANTNRKFIGIEKDAHYFEVASKRINDAMNKEAA